MIHKFKTNISFVLAAMIMFSAASSLVAGPNLYIPEPTFNFGKIPQRATVSHTFWLISDGDDTLRITNVVPGCGCTRAPLMDSVLAPGDSTAISIYFDSKSYRGFVSKKPYLETNIGDEKLYLQIHSEVLPEPEQMRPIKLRPYILDVSQFSVKPRRRARAWIINQSENDLTLNMLDDKEKSFAVILPQSVKANDSAEIIITVNEDAIETEFSESFTFEISDEVGSRFSLPVRRMYRIPQENKSGK
ncbi:MAG: DUF1573 domain-containing protein [candidate division Zixibacteria bacterium]|nr:DUF1573 domain-containing protein [candidate division Zixibacteria bacterium]